MHEESGHEEWVLNDFEAVGVSAAAHPHAPSTFISALCGYNYWCADRRHPCSVLGMMYSLEVIASVYGGPCFGDQGVASASRATGHFLHQLTRHDGYGTHGRTTTDLEHASRARSP